MHQQNTTDHGPANTPAPRHGINSSGTTDTKGIVDNNEAADSSDTINHPGTALHHAALYIHIPYCKKKCPYCDFFSVPLKTAPISPAELIDAEITELKAAPLQPPLRSLYIGGGSPSSIPIRELDRLLDAVQDHFGSAEEITVEVNPNEVDPIILKELHRHGVNRLSIGAQSFNDLELRTLKRPYTHETIFEAVLDARDAGFTSINLDLIFAIPRSTMGSWQQSLETAVKLKVEHLSAYSLCYEPGTPLSRERDEGRVQVVDEELDVAMYQTAMNTLTEAGYEQYEVSNFAKPGHHCRHNLTYWANEPWVGIGPTAGSYWGQRRYTNVSDIAAYVEAINTGRSAATVVLPLSSFEIACETAVLNLRRIQGIHIPTFQAHTGHNPRELFATAISRHEQQGELIVTDETVRLHPAALPIANTILCDFAATES